jgi:hypothetical protein
MDVGRMETSRSIPRVVSDSVDLSRSFLSILCYRLVYYADMMTFVVIVRGL